MDQGKGREKELFRWFFTSYIHPQKKGILGIVALIFVGSSLGNISPWLYGKMLDSITKAHEGLLLQLIAVYFAITIATTSLSMLESYLGQVLTFRMVKSSQRELFHKMVFLRGRAHDKYSAGEYISRLNGDSDGAVSFFLQVITSILHIAINMAVSGYFVLVISLQLSSVSIFYIPLSLAVNILSRKHFKKLAQKRREFSDRYFTFQNQVFSHQKGICCFSMERKMMQKLEAFIGWDFSLLKTSIYLSLFLQIASTIITAVSSLYIIYLSFLLIQRGLLTIGTMVAFNTYVQKLFSSVSQVLSLHISKQEVLVSLERMKGMMEEDDETQAASCMDLKEDLYQIEAQDICFAYDESEGMVLCHFNLQVSSPGFYSIIGKNGCGKSTLALLLMRFYDPCSGVLRVNGNDLLQYSIASIRRKVTYVPKEEFFWADTIFQNLVMGMEDLSLPEVQEVCCRTGIHEWIQGLPKGYDTLVEEEGNNFSSGQKQRMSIARALLQGTKVLIFDEVTANLDGAAEREVISLLKELSKKYLILSISHKLSSVLPSDLIFVMEQGRVVDVGVHGDLIERSRVYQELFQEEAERDTDDLG